MGEIAKTLVLASAKVEIKNFALKPDGDIQETEPITVTENAQDLNRLSGRVEQLNYTVSKLREELISLQENLLATQDNRNNNRYHENNPKGNAKREFRILRKAPFVHRMSLRSTLNSFKEPARSIMMPDSADL